MKKNSFAMKTNMILKKLMNITGDLYSMYVVIPFGNSLWQVATLDV